LSTNSKPQLYSFSLRNGDYIVKPYEESKIFRGYPYNLGRKASSGYQMLAVKVSLAIQ
jgi:hypothetical protein